MLDSHGHLEIGDQIKQADGSTAIVVHIFTLKRHTNMINLTVSESYTYYIGRQEVLFYNAGERYFTWLGMQK